MSCCSNYNKSAVQVVRKVIDPIGNKPVIRFTNRPLLLVRTHERPLVTVIDQYRVGGTY